MIAVLYLLVFAKECFSLSDEDLRMRFKKTVCPGEGSQDNCEWCKERFTKKYPLTAADFERSFQPGELCGWTTVAEKLKKGDEISIGVIGGSMTFGRACWDEGTDFEGDCAWPAKMKPLFNNSKVKITNRANGGWHVYAFLASGVLPAMDDDIIIIDMVVNTVYQYGENHRGYLLDLERMYLALRKSRPDRPIMMSYTFRGSATDPDQCSSEFKSSFDYNYGTPRKYMFCQYFWLQQDMEIALAKHYRLPSASFRDAVWPVMTAPRDDQVCFWDANSHPGSTTHNIVGDVVHFGLQRMFDLAIKAPADLKCPPIPLFHTNLVNFRGCSEKGFLNIFSTADSSSFKPVEVVNWKYMEDRQGKPGWIAHQQPGQPFQENKIVFHLKISGVCEITHLKSYKNIGSSEVTVKSLESDFTQTFRLDAEVEQHTSTPATFEYHLPDGAHPGMYSVTLTMLEQSKYRKFKIMGIASC